MRVVLCKYSRYTRRGGGGGNRGGQRGGYQNSQPSSQQGRGRGGAPVVPSSRGRGYNPSGNRYGMTRTPSTQFRTPIVQRGGGRAFSGARGNSRGRGGRDGYRAYYTETDENGFPLPPEQEEEGEGYYEEQEYEEPAYSDQELAHLLAVTTQRIQELGISPDAYLEQYGDQSQSESLHVLVANPPVQ
uniref:Uncharacterized protein n=1 Tax=Chromera velia CCMP2878 TaxID=1169474 RepID=A0A0G4HQF8_9ALVE|eukprot:Cvel_30156.t1-p1 / transcript=Cvel_30156.t1 / gene=Cvel_30156 / organism=Chromera_velia_CCMP2878 / gene_product=hypothetical protein / transcript_product=hypothetical protein / location=Cvel_scaffold4260:2550-3107(-) / protein_length=186 / sequence_SO=supercontig / SO=protein_coding / is_pseudo=false